MRYFLLLATLYLAAVVQTSLADALSVGHVMPDLLALVAVLWLLVTPGRRAFLVAGLIGLVVDLISPGRLGIAAASFLLVGYGVTRLRTKLDLDHLAWQVPIVWMATTALAAILALGGWLAGQTAVPLPALLVRALGVGVYTTGVSLPLLMIIGWIREPFRRNAAHLAR
jgi:rod shape-determining protein MreD